MNARHGGAGGAFLSLILILGLIGLGVWLMARPKAAPPAPPDLQQPDGLRAVPVPEDKPDPEAPKVIEPLTEAPRLDASAPFVPKDGVIEIDISDYAGYSGIIVANGGLEPNPESIFSKKYGLKVKLSKSESENWSQINQGRFAAGATTVDVLPVLGRQFQVTVPMQVAFSRGADGIVVAKNIASINHLKDKVVVASQFNEAEFLLRYLAQEAGVPVAVLGGLDLAPPAGHIGLVFAEDGEQSCKLFASEVKRNRPRLAGCVGWAPYTTEAVDGSDGKARLMVSNRNLLVVADILVCNKPWAAANPAQVAGLVQGILAGNRLMREQPEKHLPVVAKAFGWTVDETRVELARVHFSNLPENQAFFSGAIDAAGSFGSIYQSSVLAYGPLASNPPDAERFVDPAPLKAAVAAGDFADEKIAIQPIRTGSASAIEGQPLLSKNIRFLFQSNSHLLDLQSADNQKYLDTIRGYLQVSPGSMVLLRGHVDNAQIAKFREEGGDGLVRSMALKAMELSKQRAAEVRKALIERCKVEPGRIETVGRGWEEPAGSDSDLNRRVEVQWFALE